MARSWVVVERSDGDGIGDNVYVNGNYADVAGFIGTPFMTETGNNIFETLSFDNEITWRKWQLIGFPAPGNTEENPAIVLMHPVS